jgi:hypothetical protein
MFFDYSHLTFLYEPFPIGLAKPLMDEGSYRQFVDRFPPLELFRSHEELGRQGVKYTLSEKKDPRRYRDFVRKDPLWREFHRWIKSDEFVYGVLETLQAHHIDLGYRRYPFLQRLTKRIKGRMKGKAPLRLAKLKARFEFSALPVDGGYLQPHTDTPSKIVTLVISMLREGEWNPAVGGGTDVNRPKDEKLKYNQLNHLADFEDMEVIHTFDYTPNQAIIFVKTFNSWHSIRPMAGFGLQDLRKTLTINIEAVS